MQVGGITGYYEGGEIVVARMFGEIGKTNAEQQERASLSVPAKIPLI